MAEFIWQNENWPRLLRWDAEALLAPIAETAPGRGLLLLELARARARLSRPKAVATLDRIDREWGSLDKDSKVRSRIGAVRKTTSTP